MHTNIRGKFHSGTSGSDLDPNFRLPRTQTYGSCRVEVEMAEKFVTEMTTWAVVTGGAYRLNVECRSRSFDGDKTGGWLLVGPNQRIKVSLLPSERAKVGADEGGSGVRFGR